MHIHLFIIESDNEPRLDISDPLTYMQHAHLPVPIYSKFFSFWVSFTGQMALERYGIEEQLYENKGCAKKTQTLDFFVHKSRLSIITL